MRVGGCLARFSRTPPLERSETLLLYRPPLERRAPLLLDRRGLRRRDPTGLGHRTDSSGGAREFIPVLARAAAAVGVAGIFTETHPEPEKALCDGPNSMRLSEMEGLLETLVAIDRAVKNLD